MPRSAWTTSRQLVVNDQYLFLQGKHQLSVTVQSSGPPLATLTDSFKTCEP